MSSKIRAILFDAGNTLLYPQLDPLVQDLETRGFPASVEDFYAAERAGKLKLDEWMWPQIRARQVAPGTDRYYWSAYFEMLMDQIHAPAETQPELIHTLREGFRDIRTWSRVFPETAPFLDELRKKGYRLGVISNSVGTVEEQLGRAGLGQYFEFVLDSAIVGIEKPNPRIFEMALKQTSVEPNEAVFVGDTYSTDIGGAQLAGLRGILLDRVGAYPNAECPRFGSLSEMSFDAPGS